VPSPLAQVCPGPSQRTPGWPCPIGEPQTEPRGTSSPDYGGCFHVQTDARFITSGLDTVPATRTISVCNGVRSAMSPQEDLWFGHYRQTRILETLIATETLP